MGKGRKNNKRSRSSPRVAQRLKEARTRRGLSQQDLAKLSGLSQTAISAYERGVMEPTVGSLLTLAKALRVDPEWLMGLGPAEIKVLAPSVPPGPLPPGLLEFLKSPIGRALRVTDEEVRWLLSLCSKWDVPAEKWLGRLIALRWLMGRPLDGSGSPEEELWSPEGA